MKLAAGLTGWWRARQTKRVLEKIQTICDARGSLSVVEGLPFDIKRVYYLHAIAANARRGGHAQRTTDRVLIAVHGSFKASTCEPRGRNWRDVMLWQPSEGLRVHPGEWLELSRFSPDAVCLVLASTKHDEGDSVRDFKDFLQL